MTAFRLAYLNLTRKKWPSLVAVVAIAIAVTCSGILLRLNLAAEQRFATLGSGGQALIGAKAGGIEILLGALNSEGDYPKYLPYKLFETLRAKQAVNFDDGTTSESSYIESIIPFLYIAQYQSHRVVATDTSFFNRPNNDSIQMAQGQLFQQQDDVVIGYNLARKYNLQLGERLPVELWSPRGLGPSVSLRISGILKATGSMWDNTLFVNLAYAQAQLAQLNLRDQSIWGSSVLHYFLVYLKPNSFVELEQLVNDRTVGQVVRVDEQIERLKELSGAGSRLGFFVAVLILGLAGLSVSSMLITRFDAMSLQIAVLRAMGYQKKKIAAWLFAEGFLLGLCALILGACLDALGFPIIRAMLGNALPSADLVHISILQSFPVWLTGLGATIAAVFFPLHRVYKQDVHFSLRS